MPIRKFKNFITKKRIQKNSKKNAFNIGKTIKLKQRKEELEKEIEKLNSHLKIIKGNKKREKEISEEIHKNKIKLSFVKLNLSRSNKKINNTNKKLEKLITKKN